MAGAKRKGKATTQGQSSKSQKIKQDGQKALSKDLDIKIDEGFNDVSPSNARVYVDDDGIIFDASLNQTNIGNNNNKFYVLQLLETKGRKKEYYAFNRWGRVGDFGQTKTVGPTDLGTAQKEYEKKFKDKSGLTWENRLEEPKKGKYTFLEKSYEDEDADDDDAAGGAVVKKEEGSEDAESKLPIQTQRLVELIFNENHFNAALENIGYNQEKLPLGKLSKTTLKQGFEHLKELSSLIKHPKLAQNKYQTSQREAIEDFSNKYYSTIPHIFGRNRPPLIDNNDLLQKEVAMLDTLSDMEVANNIMKNTSDKTNDKSSASLIDKRFEQLSMEELTPLEHKSTEFQHLKDYLINTAGHTHGIRYRVQDIYRIQRKGEHERFAKSAFSNRGDKNRRLLWHGSRTTNFGGILSQGLRIAPPEAPVNGYAFGKGVYLADISTKSANYCVSSSSGGHGLLLLCEAELGNPMYELLTGDSNAAEDAKKAGCIATFGVGRTVPQAWVDAGAVHKELQGVQMPDTKKTPGDQKQHPTGYLQYNEYICYDVAQIRMRYLFRVQM